MMVESIVGRHLTVFDFIYLIFQQSNAVFYGKVTLNSVSFLFYLQICKILMNIHVHEKLQGANTGIQMIISMQIFLIFFKFILGKSNKLVDDTEEEDSLIVI